MLDLTLDNYAHTANFSLNGKGDFFYLDFSPGLTDIALF